MGVINFRTMNAKVARKIRKHIQLTVAPHQRVEAEKELKRLWELGLIKFNKK